MKKLYIKPEISTEVICTEGVIATSGDEASSGGGTSSGGSIEKDEMESAGKEREDWDGLW